MRKSFFLFYLLLFFSAVTTEAQFGMRRDVGRSFGSRRNPRKQVPQSVYKPTVDISLGYGYPNEDKQQLPQFYNFYKGNGSQTGPIASSIDYRFTPGMSIGIMATHGKVSVPYFDPSNQSSPALTGSLENTSIMLNLIRDIPGTNKISAYFRTALGINIWNQSFHDFQGNKVDPGITLPDYAYQAGLGTKIKMSKNSSIFIEAGYGKYILLGGLSCKF